MGNNGGGEREKKSNVGDEKSFWIFLLSEERENVAFYEKMIFFSYYLFFLKHLPLVPFWVEQKGAHLFPLMWLILSHKERKILTLLNAKILPWFVCRFSGSSPSRFSAPVGAHFRK